MFENEKELVQYIYEIICSDLDIKKHNLKISKEGKLNYNLPNKEELSHKSDILISNLSKNKFISIEVKFKSCVTDVFKSRSYDILNMKNTFGNKLLGIMIFIKPNVMGSGLSIDKAKIICYPFDIFIGLKEENIMKQDVFNNLINKIINFIDE